jgi:hypothetical protein
LKDIGIGNYFLNRTPTAQEIRARITNFLYSKRNSYHNQETVQGMGEKFISYSIDKGLISIIYK